MIQLKNLSVRVEDLTILENIQCEFNKKQFWGIIGKNGLGKTSLLNCIAGLSTDYSGQIHIDGKDIKKTHPIQRAKKISYLLQEQEPSLNFSVQQAVSMGRYPWHGHPEENHQAAIDAAIKITEIEHLKKKSILKLSGGERRKVEIATCFAQASEYLLLDEPLNHLDMVFRNRLMETFQTLQNSRCLIMVCHDLELVKKYCSHVLMILSSNCYHAGRSDTILTSQNIQALLNESEIIY